jgi:hypothetical protein
MYVRCVLCAVCCVLCAVLCVVQLVLRAGSSLRTDAAVVGTVAVSTPDANFDTSNQNYGQADIGLHG